MHATASVFARKKNGYRLTDMRQLSEVQAGYFGLNPKRQPYFGLLRLPSRNGSEKRLPFIDHVIHE